MWRNPSTMLYYIGRQIRPFVVSKDSHLDDIVQACPLTFMAVFGLQDTGNCYMY